MDGSAISEDPPTPKPYNTNNANNELDVEDISIDVKRGTNKEIWSERYEVLKDGVSWLEKEKAAEESAFDMKTKAEKINTAKLMLFYCVTKANDLNSQLSKEYQWARIQTTDVRRLAGYSELTTTKDIRLKQSEVAEPATVVDRPSDALLIPYMS